MSELRDFMDRLTPTSQNAPAGRLRRALPNRNHNHIHQCYHHNISFRFPTVSRGTAGRTARTLWFLLRTFRFPDNQDGGEERVGTPAVPGTGSRRLFSASTLAK